MIEAGTIIVGPEGERYLIARDLRAGDVISTDCFDPIGGAEKTVPYEIMRPAIAAFMKMRRSNG